MKHMIIGLCWLALATSTEAVDRADLDFRIRNLELKLDAMQAKPDKRIPAESMQKAQAIILLDRTKAGFLFAYQGGSGLVIVKDPKTRHWSPPAFLSANAASLGFQIGGEQSFVVILLMHTNALQNLARGNFNFAGEASGTAGNDSGGVDTASEPLTLVYTDREGLYGGASIKGDALSPDSAANVAYYGQSLSMDEILFQHKVTPTPPIEELARKIDQYLK